MSGEPHLPDGVDPNRPSAARIYDCFLGGTHNFAADRAVAVRAMELMPELPGIMKANRVFLRRFVRYAASRGIRQFLDLGSGIPTEGNVHEVLRDHAPDARVVYVDREPTAVLHARDIIGDDPRTAAVQGDLQYPDTVLADARVAELIRLDEPVCLLMIAVLHFVPDGPALEGALRRWTELAAPGSLLGVTHATAGPDAEAMDRVTDLYQRTGTPLVLRDRARVEKLLDGWVLDGGVVWSPQWRPDPADPPLGDPASYLTLAGVGVRD